MNIKQLITDTVSTDWKDFLLDIFNDAQSLDEYLTKEKEMFQDVLEIFPPQNLIFNAFNQFDKKDLKIMISAQDPYINKNEAMGLCLSVPEETKIPPSLRNIYKEIHDDIGIDTSKRNGDLTHWAQQGILMLNSALTVREGKSNSHQKAWMQYTNQIIKKISDEMEGVVFILWGKDAQNKIQFIDEKKHYIIKGVHPSPLSASRGFFGCKHFSQCNTILKSLHKEPINW